MRGMEYTMEYAAEAGPHDEVIEDKGVRILIEPSAILFLLGTEMDYKTDKLKSGFVFNNPNQIERLRLRHKRGNPTRARNSCVAATSLRQSTLRLSMHGRHRQAASAAVAIMSKPAAYPGVL